ncbi:hypothetical protein NLJ89_g12096 [Agrocybe chaxingu]|uniref:Homeobox domain-containing protein n=1 Tax=Agrocybe chaxingu TaxID=84603 RepID=A0A9W8JN44_9AGAR|nr:hypothetical protein NLJ89_g12096 [Agrocybe chaxingu]
MSKSRSPTPTRNLSTSNIVTSPRPTASRIQLLDEHAPAPSDSLSGARLHEPLIVHLPSPPPLASSSRFLESSSTRRSSHLIRPAEASPEEPMAKRMRRDSPAARGRPDNHSSPSSDSQDDMADSEMDVNKSSNPEPQPPAAPPKKKRTRTLTTPHQSAVLHALLAQSRFPTTAMREEVGRSIGLSARKVQIWFQNQRQKARRPRSQGEPPSSRPPQYGPFPGGPESTGRGFEEHRLEHMPYPGQPLPELQAGTGDIPGRLLGPGMPGAIPYSPQAYRHAHPTTSAPLCAIG